MVRQLIPRTSRNWKATLATVLAAALVGSHIMACIDSPMAFSPTGDLAFSVAGQIEKGEVKGATGVPSRVLVIDKGAESPREIERNNEYVLSGPSYSRDGALLAYLRIPILGKSAADWLDERSENESAKTQVTPDTDVAGKWMTSEMTPATEEEIDQVFDRKTILFELKERQDRELGVLIDRGGLVANAVIVVRNAKNGNIIEEIQLAIPIFQQDYLTWDYYGAQPIFSPDGRGIYLAMNGFAYEIDIRTGEKKILAGNVDSLVVSPDGRHLAANILNRRQGAEPSSILAILATDGSRSVFARSADAYLPWRGGMIWTASDRLVVLSYDDDDDNDDDRSYLITYDTGGAQIDRMELPFVSGAPRGLALSPDGDYLTVVTEDNLTFLSADGFLLGSLENDTDSRFFASPIYTPDSRQVALKLIEDVEIEDNEDPLSTTTIVFFTPGGQELFRVPVPALVPERRSDQAEPVAAPSAEPGPGAQDLAAEPAPATEEAQE